MKSIILAAMLAAAAVVSTSVPSQATSLTVATHERGDSHHWRGHAHRVQSHCYVKTARYHEHGRLVVKKTRVCR